MDLFLNIICLAFCVICGNNLTAISLLRTIFVSYSFVKQEYIGNFSQIKNLQ